MSNLTEATRLAYFTAAYDLSGALKIQQVQYRKVLDRNGVPDRELELLPIELLKAPLPLDTIVPKLRQALGDVAAGKAARVVELEAELAAKDAVIAEKEAAIARSNEEFRILLASTRGALSLHSDVTTDTGKSDTQVDD